MSSYAFTPANTWGTTRGGGATALPGPGTADSPSAVTGSASTEAALQSGWNSVLWDNPFFWLVLVILLFMGYVMFRFDIGVKRVGSISLKGGK